MKPEENIYLGFSFNCLIELQYQSACFFSPVLYSSPHCSISSLPILQYPLLQAFMPSTLPPQNH